MTALKLQAFGGMIPSWSNSLLPDGQASYARDCYLISGNLVGWRQPKLLRQLTNSSAQYVYRIPNKTTNNTSITATDSIWLEYNDPDTNVLRTPVVQDQFLRHYSASPSQQPMYNTYDRIVAGQPWWLLGVPSPTAAPGVDPVGGSNDNLYGSQLSVGDPGPVGPVADATANANAIYFAPITPTGSGTIGSVSFMGTPDDDLPDIHWYGAVYSDLNGLPYQLLAQGEEVNGMVANVINTSTITNGVSTTQNTTYWLAVIADGDYHLPVVNPPQSVFVLQTYPNGPPQTIDPNTVTQFTSTSSVFGDVLTPAIYAARAYVYTYVTAYDEEGPPSLPTMVNGWNNATWNITMTPPAAGDMGTNRNITHINIYRTISNQSGLTTYFFVAQIPATQTTYADILTDDVVATNAQLVSLYWFPPPTDLQGISSYPNGITVGFRSNEVWFSEAYRPHAWPPGYVLTVEMPIVGIGICGQAIVVCTQGTPYLISGVNPATMAMTRVQLPEPCLHRGSIVGTPTTVLYTSMNGLIQVSNSGAGSNITDGWISRERWAALTPQVQVRAIPLMTSYYAFGSDGTSLLDTGFTVELSQVDQTSFTIYPQAGGHRIGFSELSLPNGYQINNVQVDPWTGVPLFIQNGGVWYIDFADPTPVIVPFKWTSKTYHNLSRKNFQACRVFFTVPPGSPTQGTRNTSDPQPTLGPNQYGIVRFYTDGNLFCTREIRTSGELLRIYAGSIYEQWQVEVEARINLSNLQFATSVKELGLI